MSSIPVRARIIDRTVLAMVMINMFCMSHAIAWNTRDVPPGPAFATQVNTAVDVPTSEAQVENRRASTDNVRPDALPQRSDGGAGGPAGSSLATIQVYRSACLQCHDSDGRGEVVRNVMREVPDFTDPKWHASRSDAQLSHSILEGKGKSMRPMKNKLGRVDVTQMVSFVRAFNGGKQTVDDEPEAPEQPAAAAEPLARAHQEPNNAERNKLFRKSCTMCHGVDGKGSDMRDSLPAIPNFSRGEWQKGRSDPQLVLSILNGKGTGMPPFRGKLTREQARDLVALIREFDPSGVGVKRARGGSNDFEIRFKRLDEEFESLREKAGPARPGHQESKAVR
jgi:mono/diheme cytochrome c family protein